MCVCLCVYIYICVCLYLCLMFVSGKNVCTFVYARCVWFCVHVRVREKIWHLALSLLTYVGGGLATTSAPIALGLQLHMAMLVFLHWCQAFELWFPCLRQVLVPKKSNFESWKNAFDSLKFFIRIQSSWLVTGLFRFPNLWWFILTEVYTTRKLFQLKSQRTERKLLQKAEYDCGNYKTKETNGNSVQILIFPLSESLGVSWITHWSSKHQSKAQNY